MLDTHRLLPWELVSEEILGNIFSDFHSGTVFRSFQWHFVMDYLIADEGGDVSGGGSLS